MSLEKKQALKDELLMLIEGELAVLERAQAASREAATHEEAKPENDKDTRAIEQSYLASGQAARVGELRANVIELRAMALRAFEKDQPIALGALVTIEENDEEKTLFLAPQGGGTILKTAQVVTPRSPLGRALIGRRAGDDLEVTIGPKKRAMLISRVE